VDFVICKNENRPMKIERDLRIVGGTTSRPHQFPHAVALVLHLRENLSSFCGGSIIHVNYVLTVSDAERKVVL
jgi:secreted trypsin-like serine protease